jgi:hypothetical protein
MAKPARAAHPAHRAAPDVVIININAFTPSA